MKCFTCRNCSGIVLLWIHRTPDSGWMAGRKDRWNPYIRAGPFHCVRLDSAHPSGRKNKCVRSHCSQSHGRNRLGEYKLLSFLNSITIYRSGKF